MQVHINTNTEEPINIDHHDGHTHSSLHDSYTLQSDLNHEPQQSEENNDFIEIQQHPKKSKPKWQKSYLNMGLFIGLQHDVFDRMPWKTIGNKIYAIKCSEDYWWDKQIDGYHWKFTKSSQVGLNGIWKFGTCRGSFICKNDNCTKYTTENVCNQINLQKNFNGHTCKSCGFYVYREFCGCVKVTEFDRDTNVFTIYHQGTHTCNP